VSFALRWGLFFTGWYLSDAIYNLPKASPLDSKRSALRFSRLKAGKAKGMKTKDSTRAIRFHRRRTLRLSADEDERLVDLAAFAGLSVSEYMRRLFFGGRPIIAQTDGQMIRELQRMGGLLKHVTSGNPVIASEMQAVLESIRQAIDRLAART